jgi:hypothetical protein
MVPVVTAVYVGGLLILPTILVTACGWISQCWTTAGVKRTDLTCSFILALVPLGFSMWLAHFSNHLVAGWDSFIPVVARFSSRAAPVAYPPGWMPDWLPSLELLVLGMGLLLTLHRMWQATCRQVDGRGKVFATMSPWAVLAGALYSAGIWIVSQPMQMRGMVMR